MALSEIQQAEVKRRLGAFCDARVPPAVRSKVRVGFRIKGAEMLLLLRATSVPAAARLARNAGRKV
jgi:hypothetical protein